MSAWDALLDDLWVTPNDTRLTSEVLRKHRPAIEAEAVADYKTKHTTEHWCDCKEGCEEHFEEWRGLIPNEG